MEVDELLHLRQLITIHKRRLFVLEEQSAKLGLNCPVHILTDIEDTKEKITLFERTIKDESLISYTQGRDILHQFGDDIQNIEQDFKKATFKESKVFRIFGIEVWSVELSRTINVLIVILSIGTAM